MILWFHPVAGFTTALLGLSSNPLYPRSPLMVPASQSPSSPPDHSGHWWNRTVLGAGLTSALADFCYESTTVVLPGLLLVLGIPVALLGVIEGIADMIASVTKLAAGFIADKLGHRKRLVLCGYLLTPLGQVLIALAGGWPLLLLGRMVSWFGKGLRGPLRDAIVIQSIRPETRGRAFGFHRAMDTLGAIFGPLLGVWLLGWSQAIAWRDAAGPFRLVLGLSVIPGLLAVAAFGLLVHDPASTPNPALRLLTSLRGLSPRFRHYLRAVGCFGCGDFSHSLLIMAATQLLTAHHEPMRAAQLAGLLYVVRNVVQSLSSFPVGVLADRVGPLPVLAVGYTLGATTALLVAAAFAWQITTFSSLVLLFVIAGVYMAVQESLESTVVAELVTRETLGTSLGALGTVNGVAKFLASTLVGVVWSTLSPVAAFGLAAGLMGAGTVLLTRLPRRP